MRGARQRAEALAQLAAANSANPGTILLASKAASTSSKTTRHPTAVPPPNSPSRPDRRVFLEGWAYVTDGTRGHFGRSGASRTSRSPGARSSRRWARAVRSRRSLRRSRRHSRRAGRVGRALGQLDLQAGSLSRGRGRRLRAVLQRQDVPSCRSGLGLKLGEPGSNSCRSCSWPS